AHLERGNQDANLADNLAGREIAHEPHLSGETERAGHRAPDLRRDAEGHRRRVGDEHRLDDAAVAQTEGELLGAIDRFLALDDGGRREAETRRQRAAKLTRQVGHPIYVGDSATIDPAEDLPGVKAWVS